MAHFVKLIPFFFLQSSILTGSLHAMKFAVASEHREFFQKEHTIEFDGLLSAAQIPTLNSAIEEALEERLSKSTRELDQLSPGKLYMGGHDLWRVNPKIKKIVTQKQLAEIASDLVEIKPIRLGYDQLFPELRGRTYKSAISDAYHQLLNTHLTLKGVSSIDGILCGVMLCLKGDGTSPADPGTVFTNIPGNGVFFSADAPLDFQHIQKHPLQRYLLITYARKESFYNLNDQDPHTYFLKNMDLSIGEKLTEKSNPTILR